MRVHGVQTNKLPTTCAHEQCVCACIDGCGLLCGCGVGSGRECPRDEAEEARRSMHVEVIKKYSTLSCHFLSSGYPVTSSQRGITIEDTPDNNIVREGERGIIANGRTSRGRTINVTESPRVITDYGPRVRAPSPAQNCSRRIHVRTSSPAVHRGYLSGAHVVCAQKRLG